MTAATFQTMYQRIDREINKTTGTTYETDIKNALVSAIRFYEHRPVWFTEKVGSDLTLTSGSDNVALPADFASMKCLRIVVDSNFRGKDTGFAPVHDISALRAKTGPSQLTQTPAYWALLNAKIYTETLADENYTLKIDYHMKDTSYPSGTSDTSIWFDEAQDVIRWMAMSIFYGDRMHDEQNEAKYFARAESAFNVLTGRSNTRDSSYRVE